eukprot:2539102-Prymnesium_polylepis.1
MRWRMCAARHRQSNRRFCPAELRSHGGREPRARNVPNQRERAGAGSTTRWSPAGRLLLWRELRYRCRCAPASWSYGPVVEWYVSASNSATSAA